MIQPLNKRVLVRPLKDGTSKGGIVLPDTAQEAPQQGTVMAVYQSKTAKVKIGDTVLFNKYGPDKLKFEGEELYIIREEELLAILCHPEVINKPKNTEKK